MIIPILALEDALKQSDLAQQYGVLGPLILQPTSPSNPLPSISIPLLRSADIILDVLDLKQIEEARHWLHDGAIKAIIRIPATASIEDVVASLSGLPRERVGVCLEVDSADSASIQVKAWQLSEHATSIVLHVAEGAAGEDSVITLAKAFKASKLKGGHPTELLVQAPSVSWSAAGIKALHDSEINIMIHGKGGQGVVIKEADETGKGSLLPLKAELDAVDAFIACLRTDRPDGLYTTVVVDECNIALGLVYSAAQSIRASVACNRGVYYSRSRGGLWRKGDSSGAVQELVRLDIDCDSDALRFTVRQRGNPPAFCHLNRRNCWREDRGLAALQRTLEGRKKEAPEGSYTSRLFNDPQLLRNKLVEEAQELSEAQDPDDVAAEAADVLYFAMVRCVAAGVNIEDIERHLDARALKLARRPGNAKAHRVEAAQAILNGGEKK